MGLGLPTKGGYGGRVEKSTAIFAYALEHRLGGGVDADVLDEAAFMVGYVRYKFNQNVVGLVGYRHLFAGSYVEDTGAGQEDIQRLYVRLQYTF